MSTSRGQALAPQVLFEIADRDGATRTLTLSVPESLSVGRGRTDIVLSDPRVSRLHAELAFDAAGKLMLRDRQSANGTYFRAEAVHTVQIPVGGAFKIGDTTIRVLSIRHHL